MLRQFRDRSGLWITLLLVIAVAGIYWQTSGHGFISFDDDAYVTKNTVVQRGLKWSGVVWAFESAHASNWHPLTWLSHMLDCELSGLDARGHHLTSALLHLVNTLLLFLLLTRLTGLPWRSGFVAAAFAVHPLHVESVAWVAERKDVLSTAFWMLTTLAYVRYARGPSVKRYAAVALLFALGLMAKPMLVTLPLTLLLLDYWPLGRFAGEGRGQGRHGRLILEKVPLFALAAASCVITYLAQRPQAVAALDLFPIGIRVENALVAYVSYIGKMVWPARLAIFYPHPESALPAWQVAAAALGLVGITAAVLRLRRPYLVVGWLWYLTTLLPVIGLIQVGMQSMADRYTYVPLIGLFVAVAWGAADLIPAAASERPRSRRERRRRDRDVHARISPLAIPALAVIVVLAYGAWLQTGRWRDSRSVFRQAVGATSRNYMAQNGLASAMFEDGEVEEAIAHYRKAIAIRPRYARAHYNLAVALESLGKLDEAAGEYGKAVAFRPDLAEAHNNLGSILARQGRTGEAVDHYSRALQIDRGFAVAHCNLALLLMEQGKLDEAVKSFSAAIRLKPDYARAHCYLGAVLEAQGKIDEAIEHCSEALRLDPGLADAHVYLAAAYYRKGDYESAWREVRLAQDGGVSPDSQFLEALSAKTPEPQ